MLCHSVFRGSCHDKSAKEHQTEAMVLSYAQQIGNISKACRYFGISRQTLYEWKRAHAEKGGGGVDSQQTLPRKPNLRTPPEIEENIPYLRRTYHLGQMRIARYLMRYHGIKISSGGVYHVLKRHGMRRLPQKAKKRTLPTHR